MSSEGRKYIEKERTILDAKLLKGGAEYVVDDKTEEKQLAVTPEQLEYIQKEET